MALPGASPEGICFPFLSLPEISGSFCQESKGIRELEIVKPSEEVRNGGEERKISGH